MQEFGDSIVLIMLNLSDTGAKGQRNLQIIKDQKLNQTCMCVYEIWFSDDKCECEFEVSWVINIPGKKQNIASPEAAKERQWTECKTIEWCRNRTSIYSAALCSMWTWVDRFHLRKQTCSFPYNVSENINLPLFLKCDANEVWT